MAPEIGPTPHDRLMDRDTLVAQLKDGSMNLAAAHDVGRAEEQAHEKDLREWTAHIRFGDPNKSKKAKLAAAGPEPEMPERHAGDLTLRESLLHVPGVTEQIADLILGEYDFDGRWTLSEIGSAEANLVDSAVRLALGKTKE